MLKGDTDKHVRSVHGFRHI